MVKNKSVHITDSCHKELKKLSADTGVSMNELANTLLYDEIMKMRYQEKKQ